MLRNLIVSVVGALVSFPLTFAGWRLALILGVGSTSNEPKMDAVARVMVLFSCVVTPLIFIVLSAAVASIVARTQWWLGGVALLPLSVYGLVRGPVFIILLAAYVILAFASAFFVSRLKSSLSA